LLDGYRDGDAGPGPADRHRLLRPTTIWR